MTRRRGYFRAREIAELTGLSLRTVRRRIADETLRSVKWGGARLVPASELAGPQEPASWDITDGENEYE
jgi:excisionase family DNA binding protein